jgi:hypothetical protein
LPTLAQPSDLFLIPLKDMQLFNQSSNSFTSVALEVSEGKVGALDKKKKPDEYLEKLLNILNESRKDTKYKPITYPRLNMMLKKLGKSKKNWDRNIFIGSVLDAPNPSKYFWWKFKNLPVYKNL